MHSTRPAPRSVCSTRSTAPRFRRLGQATTFQVEDEVALDDDGCTHTEYGLLVPIGPTFGHLNAIEESILERMREQRIRQQTTARISSQIPPVHLVPIMIPRNTAFDRACP